MKISDGTALDALKFGDDGLIPVIAQHATGGEILMLAFATRAALERTLADGVLWFWSRSRRELWRKGDTSGNVLRLVSLHHDCDADALVAHVLPTGPACHTGARSCFDAPPLLTALDLLIAERAAERNPSGHTGRLLTDGNLRLKKLGEEAVELALACERGSADVAAEGADLLYHTLVACRAAGVGLEDLLAVLADRRGISAAGAAPGRDGTASAE